MPARPARTVAIIGAGSPWTNGSPARAGKAPLTPFPVVWWQAEQLSLNRAEGVAARAAAETAEAAIRPLRKAILRLMETPRRTLATGIARLHALSTRACI